jgi:hypothetical protein
MPTVNKQITDLIIANNGYYPVSGDADFDSDPQVIAVVTYGNIFDETRSYAICYTIAQLGGYLASKACTDVLVQAATQRALDAIRAMADQEKTKDLADLVYNHFVATNVTVFS